MQPAVHDRPEAGFSALVVALKDVGALDQDLAVVGDPDLDAWKRLADREELVLAQRVRADPGRGLCHPPPVEDRNSDRPEELLDLARQACAAADEKAQPAARQPLAKRGEDEPVRHLVLNSKPGPRRLGVKVLLPDLDRPVEQPAPRRTCVAHACHDGRIHLFVHARHAAHHGRLNLGQLSGQVIRAARDPRLAAIDHADEDVVDPLEDMCVWQERERRVGIGDRMHFDRRFADVDQVAMRELDTLRIAGGAGGVDDRAEVVRLDP